jgi:hypothetical protein
MSESTTVEEQPVADAPRLLFSEGSVQLPTGYEDRTTNLLVPANTQVQPNLSIARDWMKPGETLATYVDRQMGLLKSQLAGHRVIAREPVQLGSDEAEGLTGERIDASYKNGKLIVHQRQAAFEVAPSRVLVFTASSLNGFRVEFEQLWAEWLASYQRPPVAEPEPQPNPEPEASSTGADPANDGA